MSYINNSSSVFTDSSVVFTDGSEMDIYGIPMIIEEPLRNKYGRFALFMCIIIVILIIVLIMAIINIKKHKEARTQRAQNLYDQYSHERDLCKILHSKLNPPSAQYVEILIDHSSFPNIKYSDLSNMISYLITVDRDGELSSLSIPNSKWKWSGSHWKTLLYLNDSVNIRSVTIISDINIMAKYSLNSTGNSRQINTVIVTIILRNKLGNMIWQKTSGNVKNPFINVEIDKDLFV